MTRTLFAVAAIAALGVVTASPTAQAEGDKVTPVRAEKLPNVPGKSLTAVVVGRAVARSTVSACGAARASGSRSA